jgi:hypothetical protein
MEYFHFRILEMEQDMRINNRLEKSEIELWDCSGDLKYKKNYGILLRDL